MADVKAIEAAAKPQQTAPATDTRPEQNTATPTPVAVVALGEPAKAGPLPVETRAMADSFAGLRWPALEWQGMAEKTRK